jgi:hypothetical protein
MLGRLVSLFVAAGLACAAPSVVAADSAVVETLPFSSLQFNQCAGGEALLITGTAHLIRHEAPGHIVYRFVVSNASADAIGSDASYRVTYQFGVASAGDPQDGAPSALTVTQTIRFTRVGEDGGFVNGDDFMITAVFHRTVNPDGSTTAQVDEFRLMCQ